MLRQSKFLMSAAALSAALFFAAAPAHAQRLVGTGHGSYKALNSTKILHFSYFVKDEGHGAASGFAIWRGPDSIVLWRVTSVMTMPGTATQAFAGPILAVIGTPPKGYKVGATAYTASNDNGRGKIDETASLSVVPPISSLPFTVPPQFGTLTTIQQIIGLLTLLKLPPVFRPLLRGNIWIR